MSKWTVSGTIPAYFQITVEAADKDSALSAAIQRLDAQAEALKPSLPEDWEEFDDAYNARKDWTIEELPQ